MSGTHEGEFMGIAPTGKLVMAMGIDIARVVDDEILDYWGEFDVMGLLRQLGVNPSITAFSHLLRPLHGLPLLLPHSPPL